jgi:hypothetical protein
MTEETNANRFKGKFGPLEDEMTIQKYVNKYRSLEPVKGAYKKVTRPFDVSAK